MGNFSTWSTSYMGSRMTFSELMRMHTNKLLDVMRAKCFVTGIVMIFGLFGGKASASSEDLFWKWFVKNEAALYAMEQPNEALFDELSAKFEAINEDLAFEFSPVKGNGKKEFVVSAGGIKASFPAVEAVIDAAPKLERWEWVRYRPRRLPLNNISFGGIDVNVEDVRYVMGKDGNKVGIILFMPGYSDEQHSLFGQIGYLLLDEALGEYTVATKVGFIQFQAPDTAYFDQSSPLPQLPGHFDEYHGIGRVQ